MSTAVGSSPPETKTPQVLEHPGGLEAYFKGRDTGIVLQNSRNRNSAPNSALNFAKPLAPPSTHTHHNRFSRYTSTQALDQARCLPAPPPHLLHIGIELVDQRRHGQARAVAPGFVEHQAQVFAHPVDRKAEVELALQHGLAAVVQLPALCCAFADH